MITFHTFPTVLCDEDHWTRGEELLARSGTAHAAARQAMAVGNHQLAKQHRNDADALTAAATTERVKALRHPNPRARKCERCWTNFTHPSRIDRRAICLSCRHTN